MAGYGWTKYDVRTGGSQLIHDRELHLDLQTDFVKSPDGHAWAVRVSGNPKDDTPGTIKTMIAFHLAQERLNVDQGKKLKCKEAPEALNADQSAYITCEGEYPGLDQLEFWASGRATNQLVGKPVVRQASVPEDQIWKAKCKPTLRFTKRALLIRNKLQLHSWITLQPPAASFPTIALETCNSYR